MLAMSSRLMRSARLLTRPFSSTSRAGAYVRFIGPGPRKPQNHWEYLQDPRIKVAAAVGVLSGAYYVAHLEQVPETGRWRFMNTSPAYEEEMSETTRKEIRKEFEAATLPPTHPVSRHVRRVVARILKANNLGVIKGETEPALLSPFSVESDWTTDAYFGTTMAPSPALGPQKLWDVIVVNSKIVNAMADPGIIVVFTGILPVCQDEEGLAAVLSHEIGHIVARHSAERMSSQTVTWMILYMLQLLDLDLGGFIPNVLQTYLRELPNSRAQEREADMIGLELMSRACYDPAASLQMFTRLGQVEAKLSKLNLDFLQTHPSSENRVKLLEEALPKGYAILAENPQCHGMRQQLEAFKATAHPIKITKDGELVFA